MPEESEKQWVIRGVDDETRRLVKRYAVDNDLSIGDALRVLVRIALDKTTAFQLSKFEGITPEQIQQALRIELPESMMQAIKDEVARQIKKQE